ncbi:MAG: sodium:alanine symporter family protein [Ruminococcus sp.]|nr:sodium:alanine symporter family protein [Ruminococcus sp.]
MNVFFEKIRDMVWGWGLVGLLLGAGIMYTFRLRAVQLRLFPFLWRQRGRKQSSGGISQFRTVCMSLGAAMGTGNITGVAAALAVGGAGAVFWMWVSAFFGMALVYAENSLSVQFSDNERRGPMAYLNELPCGRSLAGAFAVSCLCAAFGMGGAVQVSAVADSLSGSAARPVIAIASTFVIFAVVSGGAKRIAAAAQALLPAAAGLYAAACIAVLVMHGERVPAAFGEIFAGAFGLRQAAGGTAGFAVKQAVSVGVRRGIFSNEAGLGSSPVLHSAAESDVPELQGMWAMFEVLFDTMICCTLTALALLCGSPDTSVNGALSTVLGGLTNGFISVEMSVFAFCTVIGWYYCGETAFRYLTGRPGGKTLAGVFAVLSALGAVLTIRTVWAVSDIFNALMVLPNLAGLIFLRRRVNKPAPVRQK